MVLKRKRSVDDSPLSVSSFGSFATPEAQSPTPMPNGCNGAMEVDPPSCRGGWDFSNLGRIKGGDWGMRTRKRYRDNRPAESVIHETTIDKLFSAQRKQPHAEPIPSDTLRSQPASTTQKPQKSTLHAFWNLPAPPVQPPAAQLHQHQSANVLHCDDCDTPLESDANDMDMDMDMEVDGPSRSHFACNDCGRNVCGTCAMVSNTRHCLQCATSRGNSRRWW